jgi:hypothetical protein
MFKNTRKFDNFLFNMRATTGFAEIESEKLKEMKTYS